MCVPSLQPPLQCVFFHYDSVIFGVRVGMLPDKNLPMYETVSFGSWFAADVTAFARNTIRLVDNVYARRRVSSLQTKLSENIRRVTASGAEDISTSVLDQDENNETTELQQNARASTFAAGSVTGDDNQPSSPSRTSPTSIAEHKVCLSRDERVSRNNSSTNLASRPLHSSSSGTGINSTVAVAGNGGQHTPCDGRVEYPANSGEEAFYGDNPMMRVRSTYCTVSSSFCISSDPIQLTSLNDFIFHWGNSSSSQNRPTVAATVFADCIWRNWTT